MFGKLTALFKNKLAIAIVGAALIASGGATAALAGTNHFMGLGTTAHAADGTPAAGALSASTDTDADQDEVRGSVVSTDASSLTFVLHVADGSDVSISTTASTEFEGTLHQFSDLKVGLQVHVKGSQQSNGSIAASSVDSEAEDNDQHDDDQQPEMTGTINSVDTAHLSFVLTPDGGGASKTIVVSAHTEFDGGFSGFSDLKAGLRVEVEGSAQSDGSLAATRVHREDSGGDSGDTSGSGSDDGGHHDGSGSDDGASHDISGSGGH